jgi:hypothetical protein
MSFLIAENYHAFCKEMSPMASEHRGAAAVGPPTAGNGCSGNATGSRGYRRSLCHLRLRLHHRRHMDR